MGARPVSSLDQVLQIIVFLQLLVSDIRPPALPTSLVLPVLLLLESLCSFSLRIVFGFLLPRHQERLRWSLLKFLDISNIAELLQVSLHVVFLADCGVLEFRDSFCNYRGVVLQSRPELKLAFLRNSHLLLSFGHELRLVSAILRLFNKCSVCDCLLFCLEPRNLLTFRSDEFLFLLCRRRHGFAFGFLPLLHEHANLGRSLPALQPTARLVSLRRAFSNI